METSVKKYSPFDFINSINGGSTAVNLLQSCTADDSDSSPMDNPAKQYVPFIINRGLSYFNDTVLFANEMNMHHGLPPKMQYDFYRHAIRPRKRFSKWSKKIDDSADIQLLQQHYKYNATLAREAHSLLSTAQMAIIRKMYDKGGSTKRVV
jgi:hypothetical protein